jgi:oligopeptide/dipeptide ABC transporter ATP-binding protein
VVRHLSTEIAVMYLGRLVERAPAEALFEGPLHPYTQALLSAIPVPDPIVERKRRRLPVRGEVPSPLDPPSGCHFHPRCPFVMDRCKTEPPPLEERTPGRWVACHLTEPPGDPDAPGGAVLARGADADAASS